MVAIRNLIHPITKRRAIHSLSVFIFQGENNMSALTLIAILIALVILGWGLWFIIEFIRYITTGEYETDKRLRDIS
jgi:hypothetical protein